MLYAASHLLDVACWEPTSCCRCKTSTGCSPGRFASAKSCPPRAIIEYIHRQCVNRPNAKTTRMLLDRASISYSVGLGQGWHHDMANHLKSKLRFLLFSRSLGCHDTCRCLVTFTDNLHKGQSSSNSVNSTSPLSPHGLESPGGGEPIGNGFKSMIQGFKPNRPGMKTPK